jgi:hypothetical protein
MRQIFRGELLSAGNSPPTNLKKHMPPVAKLLAQLGVISTPWMHTSLLA